MGHPVQNLCEKLRAQGKDFELLSALPGNCVRLRFAGPFQGEDVVWDMQLSTLTQYERQCGLPSDPARRGLMHIKPGQEGMMALQVAVRASSIDLPTVQKVIIMLRNYKQLRLGLHAWSDERDAE